MIIDMPSPGKFIDRMVIRGSFDQSSTTINGDRARIQLWDGTWNYGYRVVAFYVWGLDTECHGTLRTQGIPVGATGDRIVTSQMNAANNVQIAWASGPSSGVGPLQDGIVDPSNLVIEDLYVFGYATGTTQPWNYMIVMDKYDISEMRSTAAMIENNSQGPVVRDL